MYVLRAFAIWVRTYVPGQGGQDLIEYALLGGLIAGALLTAAVFAGVENALVGMADGIGECIDFDGTDCTP
jgi:Flp pilus assembly pilin Flp